MSAMRAILPAVAVGVVLRCWNLPDQVLVGDEVHALRVALHSDFLTAITTYRTADPCLPLAGLFRLGVRAGLPLSEMLVRLPVLICGVASLVVLPWLAGRLVPRARTVFAWLLALSPALILYSRIVRPYAPIVLWTGLACVCFWTFWNGWRTGGGRSQALPVLGFVTSAALAVWFHLGTVPLIASLFVFALLDLAVGRPAAWASIAWRLVGAGLALTGALALVLLPAWASLRALAASKPVAVDVPMATYGTVLALMAGTGNPLVAALFWLAAAAGLVRLLRLSRRAALFGLVLVAGQVIGIRLLSPIGLEHPIAFHRYLLPILPMVLLWVALALSPPGPHRSRWVVPLQVVAIAGLVLAGPFTRPETWRTSFLHDEPYVEFTRPLPRAGGAIAAAAERLATVPGARPIVAASWPPNRYGARAFAPAQAIHGRRVIVVTPGLAGQPAVAFRNYVTGHPPALLATGAQFLVVHHEGPASPPAGQDWPDRLRRELGPPAWREGAVEVWDLDAARARTTSRAPS